MDMIDWLMAEMIRFFSAVIEFFSWLIGQANPGPREDKEV